MLIRAATFNDQPSIIGLITSVYVEYGEKICLEGADADLTDIKNFYVQQGGQFWVLVEGSTVIGTHAALPADSPEICRFRRLYLAKPQRGVSGWGARLMQVAIDWAREQSFRRIEFWSDVRFERAHQFFAKSGFRTDGNMRTMHDGHEPYHEYFFWMDLAAENASPTD